MLLSLINGLVNALPQLVAQVPAIIASIVNTLAQNLPQIITAGIQIIVTLASGLVQAIPRLLAALPQIIAGIKNGFAQVNWGGVGMNIIKGIAAGLAGAAKQLAKAAADAAGNALDWVKRKLGIHSPSRVFRDEVGVMIGRGMAVGIDRSAPAVQDSLRSMNMKLAQGLDPIDISGSITRSASVALPDGIGSGRGRDDASLQDVVDALLLILNSLPRILDAAQPDGISERDFGRLVRQYA